MRSLTCQKGIVFQLLVRRIEGHGWASMSMHFVPGKELGKGFSFSVTQIYVEWYVESALLLFFLRRC